MIPDSYIPEIDHDNEKIRIESLGRIVNELNRSQFEHMLRERTWSGAIDITGWTLDAVLHL